MAGAVLRVSGYDVLPATDVMAAYHILQSKKVDALILDVRLVGHSGLEVLEFVRSIGGLADLPVMILTGLPRFTASEEDTIRRNRAYVFYKTEGVDEIAATLDRPIGPRPPSR